MIMIDEKKIEEAAFNYSQDLRENFIRPSAFRDFKEGARFAIEEFLKDLWHDAKEEPNVGERILMQHLQNGYVNGYKSIYWEGKISWHAYITELSKFGISKWLYIDDLFPKQKGGEQ